MQQSTGRCAWCLVCRFQFQYLQLAAWSLVSCLSICRDHHIGTNWVLTLTLVPRHKGMHHALNYTFFICVNVGSIKYQLVRPQPATWASDKFESQLSDGLIITRPGEARCHSTQCSHPLYLPSCTVLYWPGGAVRSVPILCLCPPSPVIGKYDPTLHTSHQPVSSVSSHITPFYYRYTLLSYISRGQGYSVYPRFVTLDLHCPGGRLMVPHHGAMSCCLSAPGSQRQPPSVLISPSNTTPGP